MDALYFTADFQRIFGNVVIILTKAQEGIWSISWWGKTELLRLGLLFASALQLGWKSRHRADWAASPPQSKACLSLCCWSSTEVGVERQKQDVRSDASLPARGEDRQNEKVEENFVRKFQEYRWVAGQLSLFCCSLCGNRVEACFLLQQQQQQRANGAFQAHG